MIISGVPFCTSKFVQWLFPAFNFEFIRLRLFIVSAKYFLLSAMIRRWTFENWGIFCFNSNATWPQAHVHEVFVTARRER